jgi:hypothetical protein
VKGAVTKTVTNADVPVLLVNDISGSPAESSHRTRGFFMGRSITLDVFGKRMLAVPTEQGWAMFILGDEGKRRPAENLVIPAHIKSEQELVNYLNDLYHEAATPERPSVRRLD